MKLTPFRGVWYPSHDYDVYLYIVDRINLHDGNEIRAAGFSPIAAMVASRRIIHQQWWGLS